MVRTYVTSAFAGALMLGLTTPALAASGEWISILRVEPSMASAAAQK